MGQISQKQFYLYKDNNGNINVRAMLQDDTIWLTAKQISELYDTDYSNVIKHIKNIYKDEELAENTTIAKFATVVKRGFRGEVEENIDYYNLDMIIAVGYRVNTKKATAFRIWATTVLKEYITKGFALDDNRLKNGKQLDKAHFRELLDRIKEIRTSERMLYQQLKDIYALSEDYNNSNAASLIFFARVQNKVHYAITGQTSAEIVVKRADAEKENMGLTTWKNSPDGRITKGDVIVAKNYLSEGELDGLKDIVNMFLDYAEMQAKSQTPIFMQDWLTKLDNFLMFNEKPILNGAGNYSRAQALKKSIMEYEKYKQKQKNIEREKSHQEYIEDIQELSSLLKCNKNHKPI